MKNWKPRCCACGIYCGYHADNGIPYGCNDPEYPEPLDPEYWCKKHAKEEYKKALKEGKKMYLYYQMPMWQMKAMKKLGLKREGYKII